MTRIHDMGGRFGYGAIKLEKADLNKSGIQNYVFEKDWHAKVWAFAHLTGPLGIWNLDVSRRFRESLPIDDYVNFSYYEKWLAALTNILIYYKVIGKSELVELVEEIVNGKQNFGRIKTDKKKKFSLQSKKQLPNKAVVLKTLGWGGSSERKTDLEPKFSRGEKVVTFFGNPNSEVKGGHTRLPNYAMGKVGIIHAYRGVHVFPDKNAHGFGEDPQPLYTVRFSSEILFGAEMDSIYSVFLDLWEPYLKTAL